MAASTAVKRESESTSKSSDFHPGAAPYGNFINYYSFNPTDNRIKFLSKDLVKQIFGTDADGEVSLLPISQQQHLEEEEQQRPSFTIFDVGCNSGVSCKLGNVLLTAPLDSM